MRARCSGFSLIEMAVVLVILGLLAFAFWKFIPQLRYVDETQPVSTQLAIADQAVVGFVMTHYRLPCPATDDSGNEASTATGCAATTGDFPFRTLGLHMPVRMRYGVHENAADQKLSLTVATQRHVPFLPLAYPDEAGYTPAKQPEWPLTLVSTVVNAVDERDIYNLPDTSAAAEGSFDFSAISGLTLNELSELDNVPNLKNSLVRNTANFATVDTNINGLDFCAALRDISASLTASPTTFTSTVQAGDIPVAYVIAHPGALDADGNGSIFDKDGAGHDNQTGSNFVMPHQAKTNLYDDEVLAAGFAELSARLSCPAALGRANGAADAARAAYDNYLVALANLQFRAFVVDVSYMKVEAAVSSLALALVNDIAALAATAISIAAAIVTADDVGPMEVLAVAAAIANTAVALVNLVMDIVHAVQNGGGIDDAINDVITAMAKRIEAEVFARKMLELANTTATRAVALDARGLLP